MDTMGTPHVMRTYELRGLEIMDLNETNIVPLPTTYTKDSMPVNKSHIPTTKDIIKWPHLKDIDLPQIRGNIDLLIGNNVPDACTPLEVRAGPRGAPPCNKISPWMDTLECISRWFESCEHCQQGRCDNNSTD